MANPMAGPDVEKGNIQTNTHSDLAPSPPVSEASTSFVARYWKPVERILLQYNVEARGVQRVLPEERTPIRGSVFANTFVFWFSINLQAILVTLGMLGPTVYSLSFFDCSLLGVFGSIVGTFPTAYIATLGPQSGNRTMILTQYIMGWWPSKLIMLLTLAVFLGYSLIDVVIGGQILSAVSPDGHLTIIVGIVITSIITWFVSTFGIKIFHMYERYAWLPQFIVLCILAGIAGPHFDLYTNPSADLPKNVVAGNRLSFFSLNLAAQITYAQGAADFFVYYPVDSSRSQIFAATVLSLATSSTFALLVGIGLASGIANNAAWAAAYDVSQGALIVEAFRPLGGFGLFCSVVIALGIISNIVPPTYSIGLDCQALGGPFARVPRIVWNTLGVVVFMVCAIAGRSALAAIFTNFVSLMGYWVSIWIGLVLEDHLIFRKWLGLGYRWDAWNDRRHFPLGVAALCAFLVGWAGAVLSMAQVWFTGPISMLIAPSGGDMGEYVGFAWAAILYPPLRWVEWKMTGR